MKLSQLIVRNVPVAAKGTPADVMRDKLRSGSFDYDRCVFIVDSGQKLEGYFSSSELIRAEDHQTARELMRTCPSVGLHSSPESAASAILENQSEVMAVNDESGNFFGVLPPLAIMDILRREHIQDLDRLVGIRKELGSVDKAMTESPVRSVRHRLPWLLVGLVGSFIATFMMEGFEEILNSNISLAFFIPGIVYLADAIGTQTETIVIRGLSLNWSTFRKLMAREFFTGLLIGTILGGISFAAALAGNFDVRISIVVALSILVAGAIATSIGLLLPWLLLKWGKDPAYGSGPLATILQDILSIFVYLLMAKFILEGM